MFPAEGAGLRPARVLPWPSVDLQLLMIFEYAFPIEVQKILTDHDFLRELVFLKFFDLVVDSRQSVSVAQAKLAALADEKSDEKCFSMRLTWGNRVVTYYKFAPDSRSISDLFSVMSVMLS